MKILRPRVKVESMESINGNPVPNQFIIYTDGGIFFQSYKSIICAIIDYTVYINQDHWKSTRTTMKYLRSFLGLTTREIEVKISNGEIKLAKFEQS